VSGPDAPPYRIASEVDKGGIVQLDVVVDRHPLVGGLQQIAERLRFDYDEGMYVARIRCSTGPDDLLAFADWGPSGPGIWQIHHDQPCGVPLPG
jgi:hypothetical protein